MFTKQTKTLVGLILFIKNDSFDPIWFIYIFLNNEVIQPGRILANSYSSITAYVIA